MVGIASQMVPLGLAPHVSPAQQPAHVPPSQAGLQGWPLCTHSGVHTPLMLQTDPGQQEPGVEHECLSAMQQVPASVQTSPLGHAHDEPASGNTQPPLEVQTPPGGHMHGCPASDARASGTPFASGIGPIPSNMTGPS